MKRLAYVDYDLNNFHANTYLKALRGPLEGRGWQVTAATGLQADASRKWCADNGVPFVERIEDLAGEVDGVAILAPSNPETHEALCERVFPLGVPTFVDKTFAPDLATAQRLFQLADQHGVATQTTSALRTTNVQAEAAALERPLRNMAVWAGGASIGEYGIHPVELLVSVLGHQVERVTMTGPENHPTVVLGFHDDRVATIDFNAGEHVPFVAVLTTDAAAKWVVVDDTKLFVDAAAAILDFLDAGEALVPRDETLAIMRVLDALKTPACRDGWVSL
ncbi:MAG: Gfo/Idh/MocA family protein [Lacipirellulaceae bacterium]